MPHSTPLRRTIFIVLVIALSAAIWIVAWQVAQSLLSFTILKDGITLVYVPAGVRLAILLICGFWGAVGLTLAFPLTLLQQFPNVSWTEMIVYSVIAGFVPYVAIITLCRLARISQDLSSLRAIHLPLLAAAVSIAGATAYTVALVGFGRFDARLFLPDVTGMATGDFLGCFAVIILVRFVIRRDRDRN